MMKNEDKDNKRHQSSSEKPHKKAPYKKAKYAWQIKRTSMGSMSNYERNDRMDDDNQSVDGNIICEHTSCSSCVPVNKCLNTVNSGNNESEESSEESSGLISLKKKSTYPTNSNADSESIKCLSAIEDSIITSSDFNDLHQISEKNDGIPSDGQESGDENSTTQTKVNDMHNFHEMPPDSVNVTEDCRIIERVLLRKWQNMHCSKALIENAINTSLEEMGVTPESCQDEQHAEEAGILTAIQRQGLTMARPALTSEQRQRILPMLDSLTQATENILTRRAHAYSYVAEEQSHLHANNYKHTEIADNVYDTVDSENGSTEESYYQGHKINSNEDRTGCKFKTVHVSREKLSENIDSGDECYISDDNNLVTGRSLQSNRFDSINSANDDQVLSDIEQSSHHFMDTAVLMAIDQQGLTLHGYSDDNYQ